MYTRYRPCWRLRRICPFAFTKSLTVRISSRCPRPPHAAWKSSPAPTRIRVTRLSMNSSLRVRPGTILELRGGREEGHLVVGLAQAGGERAHPDPQQLVGEIAVDEEQVLQVLL